MVTSFLPGVLLTTPSPLPYEGGAGGGYGEVISSSFLINFIAQTQTDIPKTGIASVKGNYFSEKLQIPAFARMTEYL